MDRFRCEIGRVGLWVLTVFLLGPSVAIGGSNGDLTNRVLSPVADAESEVKNILSGLLAGDEAGNISKVFVVEDDPNRLVLEVHYSGFTDAELRGELLDGHEQRQAEVESAFTNLSDSTDSVELVFEPSEELVEGIELRSIFLRLQAVPRGSMGLPVSRTYRLGKVWHALVTAESVVTEVVLVPVGAAVDLKHEENELPLPKLKRMKVADVSSSTDTRFATSARAGRQAVARKPARTYNSGATIHRTAQPTADDAPNASRSNANFRRVAPSSAVVLPSNSKMVLTHRFTYGLGQEEKDLGARGPGPNPIALVEAMRVDVDLRHDEISTLFPQLYQDQNPDSGVFYYLPAAYHLAWDANEGYGIRFMYTAANQGEAAGDVVIAMRLDTGVTIGEVEFAKNLLKAYAARHGGMDVGTLRALPIIAPPDVSLSGDLQHQYDIPAEQVVVNALSDSVAQIEVTLATDAVTKENLQLALQEDVGINGKLVLHAVGDALGPQEIPLSVRLADRRTFGRFDWHRGEQWRNPTAYPVRLHYVHALLLEQNMPIVYSWNLGETIIEPQSQVVFDAETLPVWFEKKAKRIWLDYSVAHDCTSCDEQVIKAVTGGVASVSASEIIFRTLSPLADTGAAEITVKARSRYFHPQRRDLIEKPMVVLKEDGQTYPVGPLYLVERREGGQQAEDPLFEYYLQVVMPDGQLHRAKRWLPADDPYQPIGRVQIENAIGFLPGDYGEAPQ